MEITSAISHAEVEFLPVLIILAQGAPATTNARGDRQAEGVSSRIRLTARAFIALPLGPGLIRAHDAALMGCLPRWLRCLETRFMLDHLFFAMSLVTDN